VTEPAHIGPSIALAILAYIILNLGFVFQKKAVADFPPIERSGPWANFKRFVTSPVWMLGFALGNLQFIPLWAALSLGPISLVTPMIGVGMITLVLFSAFYLKEEVTLVMYLGIGLTVVGLAVFGATRGVQEVHHTWHETMAIVTKPQSLVLIAGLFVGLIVPAVISVTSGFRLADVLFGIASAFAAAMGILFSKIMVAGFDLFSLDDSFATNLLHWQFFLVVVLMVGCNASSMVLQQFGFQKGKAVVLAPIFTVGCVVIPVLTGIALFAEWSRYSVDVIIIKSIAMVAVVAGVAILSVANAAASEGTEAGRGA